MKNIINNENGHGQVPSGKDLLKVGLVLVTFPVSLPVIWIKEKIKKKLEERKEKK